MIDKELIHQAAEDIDIFQADLTEEYDQLMEARNKPRRRLRLWPLAAAACVAGIIAIFLAPPRTTDEQPPLALEEPMFNVQCSMFNELYEGQTPLEAQLAHQQEIKKKGERLAAYIQEQAEPKYDY